MRKFSLALFTCVFILTLTAQKPQPSSLLWEIKGNGLQKPSYLFGTMHVSQKVAFHLGEPWYNAIDKVDVVAMELNPETWLKELMASDLLQASFDQAAGMAKLSKTFEKERYAIGKDRATNIAGALNEDPALVNSIMYRYSAPMGDYEEDSWLDMYLYQTGRKKNKLATGLESFEESMLSLNKASMPDKEKENFYENAFGNKSKQEDLYQQIQSAYRNGNIDLLDSLNRKTSTKNLHKYLIVQRNERFVTRLDSLMKSKSVFAGVGAGHLAGDEGMISMLRKLGYTVTPVVMGERDAESRQKLDSTLFDVPFKKYTSADSILSFEIPGEMMEFYSIGPIKCEISTELINGAFYSFNRIKTYSNIIDGNTAATWKMVDSLLYDYVPGKIIDQKENVVNGYRCMDITSRVRKGNLVRIKIILLPEELVILKVSAPEERAKSFLGDRFFNSVTINQNTADGWQRFTLPDKRLSVQLPARPVFFGESRLATLFSKTDLIAHDEKNQCDYLCMLVKQNGVNFLEEDTFELSGIARKFSAINDYTEKKRTYVNFKNRKALKIQYQVSNNRTMEALVVMQNLNYYVFAVYYNKNAADANRFFESIEFNLPEYKGFYALQDTNLYFTTSTVNKPKSDLGGSLIKRAFNGYQETENKDEALYKTQVFYDEYAREGITVSLFKYSKYNQFKDDSTFIQTARYYATNFNDLVIKDEKITRQTDGLQMDFLLTDTNSTRTRLCRIMLKNSAKYMLSTHIDLQLGPSEFVKKFYADFKPIDSLTGKSIYADKSDLFFEDLSSQDTIRINFARDNESSVSVPIAKRGKLIQLIANIPAMKDYAAFKAGLYAHFKSWSDKETLDFFKSEYAKAGDTASYQLAILNALAQMHTPEATILFRELITSDPPLDGESEYVLQEFEDSSRFTSMLFPDLLQLLSYDEYKDKVYHLLSLCVWWHKISPELYKDKVNQMVSSAKAQLKHILSNVEEDEDEDDSYLYDARLDDFNYLLFPFRGQENVKNHFDKILASDNKSIKYELLECFVEMKGEIPVATIEELAKDDSYRLKVYKLLNENNQQGLFPAQQKTAALFLKSALAGKYYNMNSDSTYFLEKRKLEWRGKKGYVYFYKYKDKFTKGDKYNLAVAGLIPEDETKPVTKLDFTSGAYGNVWDKDEKLDKQLSDLLYETLLKTRHQNSPDISKIDTREEEYLRRFSYLYDDED